MPRPAVLAGSMALPVESVDVGGLHKALSLFYSPLGAEEPILLELFRSRGDYIEVPRQFGIDYCRTHGLEFEDATSTGQEIVFPPGPQPREYQVEDLNEIVFKFESYYDFLFRARTGYGKTVGALIVAQRLGLSTLVVVDQENLRDQWVEALQVHFGMAKQDIGIIQGKVCSYAGKAVTVAMVQTMSQKPFPKEVYDAFGFLIVDEVHIIGAPTFNRVLMDFSAAYRLGVSATPNRKDGLRKAVEYNLGKVRVYVADQHDRSNVVIRTVDNAYSWYADTSKKMGRYINEVSESGSRNLEVAGAIEDLYYQDRDVLVLGDRIEHLKSLMDLCYYLGIPADDMGLYTGYTPVYRFEKNPKPARKPSNLVMYDGTQGYYTQVEKTPNNPTGKDYWPAGFYYTPVHLTTYSKRVSKAVFKEIKEKSRIIFATYGMFSKGVDVPRLSGGVDATPRSQAEQIQGRILRVVEGKQTPLWVTFVDTFSARSCYGLAGRIEDYTTNNSALYEMMDDGELLEWQPDDLARTLKARVAALKRASIETRKDGSFTVKTLGTHLPKGLAVERRINRPPPVARRVLRRGSSRGA